MLLKKKNPIINTEISGVLTFFHIHGIDRVLMAMMMRLRRFLDKILDDKYYDELAIMLGYF